MTMQSIGGVGASRPLIPATPPSEEGGEGQFASLLAGLGEMQGDADAAIADLAVGGDRDLHDVVLAVEMESIAFELAVQIRNRLVDAYQEIFRMSV